MAPRPGGSWGYRRSGRALGAYETDNSITNIGKVAWKKETGLLSVWILGMYNPSPSTTIVVPIRSGPESELGVKVTSDYFGSIPTDRLSVRDNVVFFAADGKFRSKIGINPRRSMAILGSYDGDNKVLTLVRFNQPSGVTDYVNSLWKLQDNPYDGDAANAYNDGPATPGAKPMGPFCELESSSPGGCVGTRREPLTCSPHRAPERSETALDGVARATLGVSLDEIEGAFQDPIVIGARRAAHPGTSLAAEMNPCRIPIPNSRRLRQRPVAPAAARTQNEACSSRMTGRTCSSPSPS